MLALAEATHDRAVFVRLEQLDGVIRESSGIPPTDLQAAHAYSSAWRAFSDGLRVQSNIVNGV